jgi:hypothetical protein
MIESIFGNRKKPTGELVPGPAFFHKHFLPENRLAEVICGLVMVMTFTATTSAQFEGTSPHAMLIAVLGCNFAWGVVDGVTYILGNLLNRGARARLIAMLKRNPNDTEAASVVSTRLESILGELLTPAQRQQVHQWVLEGATRVDPEPTKLKKQDLLTGLACFLIVFGAALPIVVPFLFIANETVALRASNGLMLALLFVMGWRWAPFANMSRLKTGLTLLTLGIVLIGITIALGG